MKKISCLLLLLFTIITSCNKNYLDVQPVNLLTADQVFNSPEAVTAYFATLYRDLPMEDFNYQAGVFNTFPGDGNTYLANYTWESFNSNSYNGTENGGNYASLYKAIRKIGRASCRERV
mgnify:FL=1